VITIGLPPELTRVPFPRKLPVAHQVLLKGFKGRTWFVLKLSSDAQAIWPLTVKGLCSLTRMNKYRMIVIARRVCIHFVEDKSSRLRCHCQLHSTDSGRPRLCQTPITGHECPWVKTGTRTARDAQSEDERSKKRSRQEGWYERTLHCIWSGDWKERQGR